MRNIMNITTCHEDLLRFRDRADLESFYRSYGLEGLEVLEAGEDTRGILSPDHTIGVHLRYFSAWMDLWKGDRGRLLEEFGEMENCRRTYGGDTPQALIEAYRQNLQFAAALEPEYLVFHVSDCSMTESMRRQYHYTDEEVIDAVAELVNSVSREIRGTPWLLFENLWYPGLTMERPEMVRRLLDEVQYPKTGVMLDVGHLLHTDPELRTAEEAVDHIHRILDRYEDLSFIRGIHLHQSLTGAYAKRCMEMWQPVSGTYQQRMWEVMGHIFRIDTHKPFQSSRIWEILDRIQPEYLVWEQISADREEHGRLLAEQAEVLAVRER